MLYLCRMQKVVGLIGYPLGHSVSPAMHNAAFKKLGLDWKYSLFPVEPRDLEDALKGMRAPHIAGFNVTIPHKESVLPLLEEVTRVARVIGAVNTVLNQDGKLIGHNTDGAGFIDSLKEDAGFNPQGKKAVVLGAGGAGRAIAIMLAEAGINTLTLVDQDEQKARELSAHTNASFKTSCEFVEVNSQELQEAIAKADLLVNSTPVGMHPGINASPLAENITLPSGLLVYDLVYNPSETKLMKTAKNAGCKTCSGLGMLVRQGALSFTLWTGAEAPVELMRKAAEQALG
jgi:shikimate dehydrogenase